MRVWALLHYLDQSENQSKLFDLQLYLRSNWPATKELVDAAISKGWVATDASHKTYAITSAGRTYLMDLRRILEPLHERQMLVFRRSLGEAIDYPK